MGISFLIFSIFIHRIIAATPPPPLHNQANGTSARSFCFPDVTLPKSCKNRHAQATPAGASINEGVTYILYASKDESQAKNFIPGDEESFASSGFNINEETKIIVHGYFSSAKNFEHMVLAYLTAADHNIMLMDWSGLSKWCYCEHVLSIIEAIGKNLGVLLDFLVEKGTKLEKIHIIGHSLGAHIAGIGSLNCNKGRVGRITALDPARPGFTDAKNTDRLEKSRADLVDVIHTSAHTFGIADAIGHFDFYPNGGQAPQPGCTGVSSDICSHSRAHYLYTESITTDVGYRGIRCSSWTNYINGICTAEHASSANMGARLNSTSEKGTYYLKTGATCPYYVVKSGSSSVETMFTMIMILLAVIQIL